MTIALMTRYPFRPSAQWTNRDVGAGRPPGTAARATAAAAAANAAATVQARLKSAGRTRAIVSPPSATGESVAIPKAAPISWDAFTTPDSTPAVSGSARDKALLVAETNVAPRPSPLTVSPATTSTGDSHRAAAVAPPATTASPDTAAMRGPALCTTVPPRCAPTTVPSADGANARPVASGPQPAEFCK